MGGVTFGLSRQDILKSHFNVYSRHLQDWQLRQQIIPMLENSGLIYQEVDLGGDKRKLLVYPTTPLTISSDTNNSESHGRVEATKKEVHPQPASEVSESDSSVTEQPHVPTMSETFEDPYKDIPGYWSTVPKNQWPQWKLDQETNSLSTQSLQENQDGLSEQEDSA